MKDFYIVTFKNTHEAMKAESESEKRKVKITVMPTPTYISKSCGISLKLEQENYDDFKALVDEGIVQFKGIYLKKQDGYEVISEK